MVALIFDCDGVLVDSESLLIHAEMEFLSRSGFTFTRTEYVSRFLGKSFKSWQTAVSKLFTDTGLEAPTAADFSALGEMTDQTLKQNLEPVEGVQTFLSKLTTLTKGVASSSTPAQLAWKLRKTGLNHFFGDLVFSSSQVANGKPAPDLFLYAASKMKVSPADCIVIEDSSSGVLAAKDAGMTVVGLVAGSHLLPDHREVLIEDGADFVAGSYAELADWLDPG